MSDSVVLTPSEIRIASWIGEKRYAAAVLSQRDPGLGPSATAEDARYHVQGALGEYGAARILDRCWPLILGVLDTLDVGPLAIRSIWLPWHQLIVKPTGRDKLPTPDGMPYALALVDLPCITLLGWYFAREAKLEPLNPRHGDAAHYMLQKKLHPIVSLRLWLASESWTTALLS